MTEPMPRARSEEEIRIVKEQGIFDVGTTYIPTHGFRSAPKHRFWDSYDPTKNEDENK